MTNHHKNDGDSPLNYFFKRHHTCFQASTNKLINMTTFNEKQFIIKRLILFVFEL